MSSPNVRRMLSALGAKPSRCWPRSQKRWRALPDDWRPLGFVAKRSNERSQCRRRLPPAGVIEIVAGKGWAPLRQNPRQPSRLDVSLHLIRVDVRETLTCQGCLTDQVGVVDYEGTVHADREGLPFLLEVPGVKAA